jgi:hypothetical protein
VSMGPDESETKPSLSTGRISGEDGVSSRTITSDPSINESFPAVNSDSIEEVSSEV